MPHNRTEDPIRPAPDIAKRHVRDVQLARMLEALVFIILAIALRNRQSVVHVIENHAVVGHVAHEAASAATGYASGHTLMRAPSDELAMVMLRTRMSSTWSMREGYWPSEPTEMPWVPLQWRFWTRMDVLLGLNDTQSDWNVSCVC